MDDYSKLSHDSDSLLSSNSRNTRSSRNDFEDTRQSSKAFTRQGYDPSTKLLTQTSYIATAIDVRETMPLRVEPARVQFESVDPGTLYVMTISTINATNSSQRIRVSQPRGHVFSVCYIPAGPVAPGLDVRVEIECMIPKGTKEHIFTDSIVVTMGSHKVEVPLFAAKPGPDIVFENLAQMGVLPMGDPYTHSVLFKNSGERVGVVTFEPPGDTHIEMDPPNFTLEPQEQLEVKIHFKAEEAGSLRELVRVFVEGVKDPMILDVTAIVVQQKVNLVYPNGGGTVDSIDFETMIFGQKRVVDTVLVNNGPSALGFVVRYPEDADKPLEYAFSGHRKQRELEL